jgi:hypothetical protein
MNPPLQAQTVLYKRIHRIGTIGKALCSVSLFSIAAMACLVTAYSLSGKPGHLAVFFVIGVIWVAGLLIMRQLFVLLTRQQLFTPQSARLIQWLGVWELIWGVRFDPAADKISDVAFSFQINNGLVLNLKPELILTGLFLLALGWGMHLAASLKQEQDLTI